MTTRRNFLKNTTMLAAGLGVSPLLSSSPLRSYQKEEVINGKVRIAVIGVGMGCRDLQGALTDNPWVHCVGMCDVNKVRLEEQLARFKKDFPEQTVSIKAYTDFREVLANKEIDGVIIATPDHWHPYIFAEALKAGKAIYVEKPVGNSISECNAMMDFQKKYKGVVTTGLWQTSQRYFRAANEILKYSTTNREGYREYKSDGNICAGCPYLSQCTESKSHVKVVTRHIWQEYLDACENIRHTLGMKDIYSKRKETIERVFGTAKEHHAMRYTRQTGKAKMSMKVGLTFACLNIKKLVNLLSHREKEGQKTSNFSFYLEEKLKSSFHLRKISQICNKDLIFL